MGGISRIRIVAGRRLIRRRSGKPPEGAAISHVTNEHYGKPGLRRDGSPRRDAHGRVGKFRAHRLRREGAVSFKSKAAVIDEIIVDTYLHRLNPPLTAHVLAANGGKDADKLMESAPRWKSWWRRKSSPAISGICSSSTLQNTS